MVDDKNVDDDKEKELPKKKVLKEQKAKYEVILVSENYLVYKTKQGNVWIKTSGNKKYKVGDTIEV